MSQSQSKARQLDALLQPSLQQGVGAVSIYSVRAGFMVAFFGGFFAAVLFGALNSQRLGRLRTDAWLYALGTLAFGAYTIALGHAIASEGATAEWLAENSRGLRIANRAASLAFFGIIFLVHRRFYKAAELAGENSLSPWLPGIAACVVGTVIAVALAGAGALAAQ